MYRKLTENEILGHLAEGAPLLPPLMIRRTRTEPSGGADARIEVGWPDRQESFAFAVEAKAQSTPQAVTGAMAQARACAGPGEYPIILVPYLSVERLAELEKAGVSGIDLCGNGLVMVPGKLFILRSGQPNLYPESRPLNNPYRGRSAMVARQLLTQPSPRSLGDLQAAIRESGAELSLSQVSKAVTAMQEDLLLSKEGGAITLLEPLRLLDSLAREWKGNAVKARRALRVSPTLDWGRALTSAPGLKWAVTGESSARRYTAFSQGGPIQIAVSSLPLALTALGGTPEEVRSFADMELLESSEAGLYFANEVDETGQRWASRLQSWLDLQAGDARQREAAKELREQVLKGVNP